MTREEYKKQEDFVRRQDKFERQRSRHRDYHSVDDQDPRYNDNTYREPYYPEKRHHHFFRNFVICCLVIAVGVFGYGAWTEHKAQNASSQVPDTKVTNTKQTTDKTTDHDHQSAAPSKTQNNTYVKDQMNRIQLPANEQQEAMQKFQQATPDQQQKVIGAIKTYKSKIPGAFLQRQAVQQFLQSHLNQ